MSSKVVVGKEALVKYIQGMIDAGYDFGYNRDQYHAKERLKKSIESLPLVEYKSKTQIINPSRDVILTGLDGTKTVINMG